MQVKLISVTQSMVEGINTPEELLTFTARASNPSNQLNTGKANKLLAFLIKQKHWSPFDMVNLCVEVKTSKAIAIQILRHWSIKPQEFSQRYAECLDFEEVEVRMQGTSNRQQGEEINDPSLGDYTASQSIKIHTENCFSLYKQLLNAGVAKEVARFVLPMNTQTTMYLNGSVRSWIHYMEQRLDSHAQKEHRLVAQEIEIIFKSIFPNVWQAIQDNK